MHFVDSHLDISPGKFGDLIKKKAPMSSRDETYGKVLPGNMRCKYVGLLFLKCKTDVDLDPASHTRYPIRRSLEETEVSYYKLIKENMD